MSSHASAAKPTRMTADARREQLLDATKAIADAGGFHAVSIDAVAREAGITRPVVYGHFGDLGGLLRALVDREAERALGQLARVASAALEGLPPDELMLTALRRYLEAVESDPVTWRLVLMPVEGAPEVLRERVAQGRAMALGRLEELTRMGLAALPEGAAADAELVARTLQAFAEEAARLVLTDPRRYPVDRVVAHAAWIIERARLAGG